MLRIVGKGLLAIVGALVAVELLLQLAAPWAQRRYRREHVTPRADTIRILCLGDSNTYGLYLPRESSWPAQLQQKLDQDAPGRFQVINLGFPGTPSSRIAENLPAFLARFRPDRVIVLAGVNDFLYGAIDASNSTPTWAERVRAFASTHVRLYRAWLLWRRARQPPTVIRNDMDQLNAALLSLHGLDDAAMVRALADVYRRHGFTVREDDGDFWLEHGPRTVHLNDTLDGFRSSDLYALTYAFLKVAMQAGYDMRDVQLDLRLRIDGDAFELEPYRSQGDIDNAAIVGRNMKLIAALVRQSNADFLMLTYAAHAQYSGRTNEALRRAAADDALPLLDVDAAIRTQCPDEACTAFFFPDYHPNAEGYRRMAALIADRIESTDGAAAGHGRS